tara:strand:+ start:646 stop:1011 length:366 start_codon:yes stop_codon:yes gene_type:complete
LSQVSLINRFLAMFGRVPKTTGAVGGAVPMSSGQQVLQQIKTGTASLSTGQSGRVLVSGAKVGGGVGIAGAGIGYGLTELGKPITEFTQPIDQLLGFSGVGSIMIIGIIILVLIIILRGKI